MLQNKRAHRVPIVDGDQAHFEQGLDALQVTRVRVPHPDSDCALVWEESIGEHKRACMEAAEYWWVIVLSRARVSEELKINAVLTYKVFHAELSPIRRGVRMEREERSQLRLRPYRQHW
jgi:hypothetical protein